MKNTIPRLCLTNMPVRISSKVSKAEKMMVSVNVRKVKRENMTESRFGHFFHFFV